MNPTARTFYQWRMEKVGMTASEIAKELDRVDAHHEARRREEEKARREEEEARRRETVARAVQDGVERAVVATLKAIPRPAVAKRDTGPLPLEAFPNWDRWRAYMRKRAASGVEKVVKAEAPEKIEKTEEKIAPPREDQQVHDLLLGAGWEHSGTTGDDYERTHRYCHSEHGDLFVTCGGGDGTVRRLRHEDGWGRSRFVAKPEKEN